jgi:6-phosphogluconolactonase
LVKWANELEQEKITIALSGGSTPKVLFQVLAEKYATDMPWHKIHFFWGDERCVPPDHQDSNFGMTRSLLLDPLNIPTAQVHRVFGEIDPAEAARKYEDIISEHVPQERAWPVFDLIILGMGSDGHTASIFPHEMEWLESKNWCEVATHPESGQQRITLTGKVLNRARQICFLVTGDSKKEKVFQILKKQGNYLDYPAAHIVPVNGTLSWNLDEAAVALLKD